jgi:hypothetical protein
MSRQCKVAELLRRGKVAELLRRGKVAELLRRGKVAELLRRAAESNSQVRGSLVRKFDPIVSPVYYCVAIGRPCVS